MSLNNILVENVEMKINEFNYPKSKLGKTFDIHLHDELKKLPGLFYVIGKDLYRDDVKLFTINGDKDSINSIIKKIKSINENMKTKKKPQSITEYIQREIENQFLIKESFSAAKYSRAILLFTRILSRRLGQKLHGNPEIYDVILKPTGRCYGIKYYIGNTPSAIRFNLALSLSSIKSIDFWFGFNPNPKLTLTGEDLNLLQLLDSVINVIKKHEVGIDYIVESKINESSTQFNVGKFIQTAEDSPSIYAWLKSNKNDEKIISLLTHRKIKELFPPYEKWCNQQREKSYKPNTFYLRLGQIYRASGLATVKEVKVEKATKEKNLVVDVKGEEQFEGAVNEFRLNPDEVYTQLDTYIESIAAGRDFSLIIAGDPGTGKTFGVTKKLTDLGFSEIDEETFTVPDEDGDGDSSEEEEDDNSKPSRKKIGNNQFLFIKGKISTYGVYELLYNYNGALIVFDDCDSVFGDNDGINLIKNATDTKKVRKIGLRNKATLKADSPVPASFDYTGKVIFITNKYLKDLDTAIISRALVVEIDFTPDEIIERIRAVLPYLCNDMPGIDERIKLEVLEYLLSIKKYYNKLDFRTYEQAVKEYLRGSPIWKKLVANAIILKRG